MPAQKKVHILSHVRRGKRVQDDISLGIKEGDREHCKPDAGKNSPPCFTEKESCFQRRTLGGRKVLHRLAMIHELGRRRVPLNLVSEWRKKGGEERTSFFSGMGRKISSIRCPIIRGAKKLVWLLRKVSYFSWQDI